MLRKSRKRLNLRKVFAMSELVLVSTDDMGVATVTLNRPDKRNAMSGEMIAALSDMADQLARGSARVVVLTGAGENFCAGGDLNWMRAQTEASPDQRRAEATKLATMLGKWNRLPKPVIARIAGSAFGGGVGLACVADIAIATEDAKFGLTETRLGLLPATIGPYVLARMGEANARRVFMSSRIFDATEAVTLGVIAKSVPRGALDDSIAAEIAPYMACAPGAVAEAKALALDLGQAPSEADVARSIDALITRWDSDEAPEGIAAFFEKRKPAWMS